MRQLWESRGHSTSEAALKTALPGCCLGMLLLGEASRGCLAWRLLLRLWRGTVTLDPKYQLVQQQEEVYFVWKSKSPKQTAGHVKMLTVSAAGAFSKEITQGCKQGSPASLLAFLYFFYSFPRHLQIPLLLVPQITPCTHNPSLLPLAPPPPPSLSGATQVHGCLLGQKWPHTE